MSRRRPTTLAKVVTSVLVIICLISIVRYSSRTEAPSPVNAAQDLDERLDTPDIAVSGTLPSLDGLPESVAEAWRAAIEAVESTGRQLQSKLDALGATTGIPGTGIDTDEERAQLQSYLDCVASEGSWIYDADGSMLWDGGRGGLTVHKQSGDLATCDKRHYKKPSQSRWNVRESMRYRWQASDQCQRFLTADRQVVGAQTVLGSRDTPNAARLPSRQELCRLLRAKAMVIIGDNPTGFLTHDLFLDWTADAPLTCYGDQFCKEHLMCTGALKAKGTDDLGWANDASPHVQPDLPPQPESDPHVYVRSPAEPPTRLPTRGRNTMLRYRRSDGGFLRSSPSLPEHDPTYVNPATGVREFNNFALALARRSDIVMYSKAPLPMPVPNSAFGNWSTALRDGASSEYQAILAIHAATALTTRVWLPELADSLRALRHPGHDHLVVYRGTWRTQPDCATAGAQTDRHWPTDADGPSPYPSSPSLRQLIFKNGTAEVTEFHALVYNLQTILQNHAARTTLLPSVGIPFLDTDTPLSVWRSGFVAGSDPANCLQTCLPSPGLALEHAIIGGLFRVMERGWDIDSRTSKWVGDGYRTIVEREKTR